MPEHVGISLSSCLATRPRQKDIQKRTEECCSVERNHESKGRMVISMKKQREEALVPLKTASLDSNDCDERVPAKKRKLKDWQDCINHPWDSERYLKEESSEGKFRNDKKSSLCKICEISYRRSKADFGFEKFSVDATSGSSKISDCHRGASFEETRGSPVESVSSSPARKGNSGNYGQENGGLVIGIGNPKKSLKLEPSECHQSHFPICDARSIVRDKAQSRVKPSKFGHTNLVNHDSETLNQLDVMSSKNHPDRAISPKKSGKRNSVRYKNRNCTFQRVKVKIPGLLADQNSIQTANQSNEVAVHNFCDVYTTKYSKGMVEKPTRFREPGDLEVKSNNGHGEENQDSKIPEREGKIPRNKDFVEIESGIKLSEGSLQHIHGKVDVQDCVSQPISRSLEESCVDIRPCDASGTNPVKDTSSQTASCALKDAEKFKVSADHLKDAGFDFECNEAYFQAALRFLHCGSLLEASGKGSSKHGDLDQIQIYSKSAKLLETCAREYEKRAEMATAALAYKCVEVAYLKVVYCKSSIANRDRYELQTSLQAVPQGESPSSSASDVENLNNQVAVDKAALSRGLAHAGKSIIVPRNRSSFMRILGFTYDVNSAMEGSRRSQSAFEAAYMVLKKSQKEGLSLVKRVIDFSFENVEEFRQLVLHAKEAINRCGF